MKESIYNLIYDIVRHIPKGRVTTYGAIAKAIGTGGSARIVGWAMNGAGSDVPAHRVVNRNGMLSGKNSFATPTLMQELLESEGVVVQDDCVVNFKDKFWHPDMLLS